jgi:hypothetical protein
MAGIPKFVIAIIEDLSIVAQKLAPNSVLTSKIADLAVTPPKADLTEEWDFATGKLLVNGVAVEAGPANPSTPGVLWVDPAADAGGDGSLATPYNDLQDACNAAYQANLVTPGTVGTVLCFPGDYLTKFDGTRYPFSNGGVEIDGFTVRGLGGSKVTRIVADTGLGFFNVVLRENAILDGFTLVPDGSAAVLVYSPSGPPQGSLGRRSVARDIIFDAEPLSPALAGACFSVLGASGDTENVLEDFEVRGEWDSGIGFYTDSENGSFYVRNGRIADDARFDFSVFYVGGTFGPAGVMHLYVENVHIPASVTVTDDCFVVDENGVLHLHDVSVDGAGANGIAATDNGAIIGDGVRVVNSVGADFNLAGTSTLALTGFVYGARNYTLTTTGTVEINGAGPWVPMVGDLAANWDDAANQGWGTEPFAYRLHSDRTVEWRGGVAATSAAALAGFLTTPAPVAPDALITVWWSSAAWEGGGANATSRVVSLGSGGAQVEDHPSSPNVDSGDVYFFDGFRYPIP